MVPTNPASKLTDVLRCIYSIFSDVGNATPLQTGKQYLADFGTGTGPKVLFVPDEKGQLGDPPPGTGGTGYEAGVIHGCTVYVRGAEDGSDLGRLDGAEDLADLVLSALGRAARGRWGGGDFEDTSAAGIDAYGAEVMFKFTYHRGVPRNAAVWSLKPNPIAPSPPDINAPPGTPASTAHVSYTVTPQ